MMCSMCKNILTFALELQLQSRSNQYWNIFLIKYTARSLWWCNGNNALIPRSACNCSSHLIRTGFVFNHFNELQMENTSTGTLCHKQALTPTEKAKMKYLAGSTKQELDKLLLTPRDWSLLAMTFIPVQLNLKGGMVC